MAQNVKNGVGSFLKSFLIWFVVFFLVLQVLETFQEEKSTDVNKVSEVTLELLDEDIVEGNLAQFTVENKLDKPVSFTSPCEKEGSMKIFAIERHARTNISESLFADCTNDLFASFDLEPGQSHTFDLRNFQHQFAEPGTFQLEMQFDFGEEEFLIAASEDLIIDRPGFFRRGFRTIVSRPLFNMLVFFTQKLPTHSFGWAVVFLTLLVRLILFIPNQKAMRSQREMQKLQPKIAALKKKHGKNQQALAMETMMLYKTHKVNPMGSCLPILLQMPFLLGIFYLIQDGLSPHMTSLLYEFQATADLTLMDPAFFGLDLEATGPWVLAILVGGAQYAAVTLSLISAKKRKSHSGQNSSKKEKSLDTQKDDMGNQMQQMNKMMQWGMPLLVGFFVTNFPAGVGIYWLTSTVFGVVQQKYVNWQMDKPQVRKKA